MVTARGGRRRVPNSGYQVVLDLLIGFLRRKLRGRDRSIAVAPPFGRRSAEDCALHDALEAERLASRTCSVRRLWDVRGLDLDILRQGAFDLPTPAFQADQVGITASSTTRITRRLGHADRRSRSSRSCYSPEDLCSLRAWSWVIVHAMALRLVDERWRMSMSIRVVDSLFWPVDWLCWGPRPR